MMALLQSDDDISSYLHLHVTVMKTSVSDKGAHVSFSFFFFFSHLFWKLRCNSVLYDFLVLVQKSKTIPINLSFLCLVLHLSFTVSKHHIKCTATLQKKAIIEILSTIKKKQPHSMLNIQWFIDFFIVVVLFFFFRKILNTFSGSKIQYVRLEKENAMFLYSL